MQPAPHPLSQGPQEPSRGKERLCGLLLGLRCLLHHRIALPFPLAATMLEAGKVWHLYWTQWSPFDTVALCYCFLSITFFFFLNLASVHLCGCGGRGGAHRQSIRGGERRSSLLCFHCMGPRTEPDHQEWLPAPLPRRHLGAGLGFLRQWIARSGLECVILPP